MFKAFKTEIEPTAEQRRSLHRMCGAARFAFNWGLEQSQQQYAETGELISFNDQMKLLTRLKAEPGHEWMRETPGGVYQASLFDLHRAFKEFFRRLRKGDKKPGFPKFKAKGKARLSIRTYNGGRVVGEERQHVYFPKLGMLRVKERGYLPTDARVVSVNLSSTADRWFCSVTVELPDIAPEPATNAPLGVDIGIKTLLVCSDGTTFENPKAARRHDKKMRRLHRKASRQTKGGANRAKTAARLRKLHYREACLRRDTLHKATTTVAEKRPRVLVLEGLNVAGMVKNHVLAAAIHDVAPGTIRRLLEYKVAERGGTVQIADRFFPSSQLCSQCGERHPDMNLSRRVFLCPSCGHREDRDLNAAKNLARLASH